MCQVDNAFIVSDFIDEQVIHAIADIKITIDRHFMWLDRNDLRVRNAGVVAFDAQHHVNLVILALDAGRDAANGTSDCAFMMG